MSVTKVPAPNLDLAARTQVFLEKLINIDSLNSLIALACELMGGSLFICDAQGDIVASSALGEGKCASWTRYISEGRVSRDLLRSFQASRPASNMSLESHCIEHDCSRMPFPLQLDESSLPGFLCFFIWDRKLTYEDQCLAAMMAGAFQAILQKRIIPSAPLTNRKISLLKELLDYKPGLQSYYARSIVAEGMHNLPGAFYLLYIQSAHPQQGKPQPDRFKSALEDTWSFTHRDSLLVIYNDSKIDTEELLGRLLPLLKAQNLSACLSMPFHDLQKLRFIYETTSIAWKGAAQKEPDGQLYHAERYLCLAFLNKCQQYFPIDEYYPDGFRRLVEYDRETGRNYLTTLCAYLDNSMNVNAAAKQIFMHRNTMTQQLEKIEQILGFSLKDKEMCLYLQLCLRIHTLLEL